LTEPLGHLPLIDMHSVAVKAAAEKTFDAVQLRFAGLLSGPVGRLMSRLWECDPPAAFEVVEAQRPNLVVLAGKHRFSRYGIVFRISPTETGCTLSAESHAVFPGISGRLYEGLVIDSRLHVMATRGLLRAIARKARR
jgi:hypothetical protein